MVIYHKSIGFAEIPDDEWNKILSLREKYPLDDIPPSLDKAIMRAIYGIIPIWDNRLGFTFKLAWNAISRPKYILYSLSDSVFHVLNLTTWKGEIFIRYAEMAVCAGKSLSIRFADEINFDDIEFDQRAENNLIAKDGKWVIPFYETINEAFCKLTD